MKKCEFHPFSWNFIKIAIFTKKGEISLNLVIFRQDRDSRSKNVNILLEFIGKWPWAQKVCFWAIPMGAESAFPEFLREKYNF